MTRELRDSGVGWLGDTPATWPVVPARALFGERKQKSAASDVHLTPSQKYGVLPQAEYMEITGNKVVLNLSGADNMRHVEAGDYVSHLRSFQGGLEFAGLPGKVSAAYTVLKPKVALESRFFKYLFKSDLYVQALQTTTDQLRDGQSIRYGQFTLIPLPRPTLEEQRAIADYLDRETAQIDAFIAKNEELITLLNERRLVEISRAISGDWPEVQLRALSTVPIQNGVDAIGDPANPQEWPRYVRTTDIESLSSLDPDKRVTIAPDVAAASPLVKDDILLTRAGATIGKSYLHSSGEVASYAGYLVRVRPDRRRVLPWYLAYWTQSQEYLDQIRSGAVISTIENFSASKYRALRVPLPTIDVQAEIVDRIRRSSADAHRAMAMATAAIELARERRAALISSAVTGKIEVGVWT